jgi:hypothetical protein
MNLEGIFIPNVTNPVAEISELIYFATHPEENEEN